MLTATNMSLCANAPSSSSVNTSDSSVCLNLDHQLCLPQTCPSPVLFPCITVHHSAAQVKSLVITLEQTYLPCSPHITLSILPSKSSPSPWSRTLLQIWLQFYHYKRPMTSTQGLWSLAFLIQVLTDHSRFPKFQFDHHTSPGLRGDEKVFTLFPASPLPTSTFSFQHSASQAFCGEGSFVFILFCFL